MTTFSRKLLPPAWRPSLRPRAGLRSLRHARWTVVWVLLGLALANPACATSRAEEVRSPDVEFAAAGGAGRDGSRWPAAQREQIAAVQPHVHEAARKYKVDPGLINAVIWVESKFDARARGRGGTLGLMQLMPATARELAERMGERSRPMDPGFNVRAGSMYLARMIARFGDTALGLAAYHGGPGHVIKWQKAGKRGVPEGSKRYVEKVREAQRMF